jgi:hypothetical protein
MLLEQLWDSGQGVLSTQVLQKLCIILRRKIRHPLPVAEVRLLIRDYATWEVMRLLAGMRSGRFPPSVELHAVWCLAFLQFPRRMAHSFIMGSQ